MIYIIIIFAIIIIVFLFLKRQENFDEYSISKSLDVVNDMKQLSFVGRFNSKYLIGVTNASPAKCSYLCNHIHVCKGMSHSNRTYVSDKQLTQGEEGQCWLYDAAHLGDMIPDKDYLSWRLLGDKIYV